MTHADTVVNPRLSQNYVLSAISMMNIITHGFYTPDKDVHCLKVLLENGLIYQKGKLFRL